jgi:hypothetical protein
LVAFAVARTMLRPVAGLTIAALLTYPAKADSDYRKVCRVGETLTVLAEDANANACRAIAINSKSQEYQIGCQGAKTESLVMLTAPISINDKSARLTTASLAANVANANYAPREFAGCANFWVSR